MPEDTELDKLNVFKSKGQLSQVMTTKPNILIVIVDSLRARNATTYGYHRETTPFLDELADGSIVYESAWSPAIWTLPSHVSMFTGYEVPEHGVLSSDDAIDPAEIVFNQLSERDYETGVFSENTWLTEAEMGIRSAFDTVVGKPSVIYPEAVRPGEFVYESDTGGYLDYLRASINSGRPAKSLINGVATKLSYDLPQLGQLLLPEVDGFYFTEQFKKWQLDQSGQWAACINFMDAHRPYVPNSEFDLWDDGGARAIQDSLERPVWDFLEEKEPRWKLHALESLYDGGIRQADSCIRQIVNSLKERDAFEDTLLIVAGDHGEAFGEYSRLRRDVTVEHKEGLHHVQSHVPLIVNPPTDISSRISEPVSLTETARVMEDVIAGESVQYERDRPVLTVYNDIDPTFVSETAANMKDPGLQSAITQDDGLVKKHTQYTDRPETAIVEALPETGSSHLLGDSQMDVTAEFAALSSPSGVRTDASIDSSAEQRLEELGYL